MNLYTICNLSGFREFEPRPNILNRTLFPQLPYLFPKVSIFIPQNVQYPNPNFPQKSFFWSEYPNTIECIVSTFSLFRCSPLSLLFLFHYLAPPPEFKITVRPLTIILFLSFYIEAEYRRIMGPSATSSSNSGGRAVGGSTNRLPICDYQINSSAVSKGMQAHNTRHESHSASSATTKSDKFGCQMDRRKCVGSLRVRGHRI